MNEKEISGKEGVKRLKGKRMLRKPLFSGFKY